MEKVYLYVLFCVSLASCSPTPEAATEIVALEEAGTIQKIAGYDVSHLELLADDFEFPYQKITGRMLLWLAAENCDTTLFFQVLRKEENPVYAYDGDHILTEITFCPGGEAILMTKALLAKGVDINAGDEDMASFLAYAVGQDHVELVSFILENGGNLSQRDTNRNTGCLPLHSVESVAMLKLLIAAGADVTSRCNNGRTLLHYTAKTGLPELAKYLVDNKLVDPDLLDRKGESALDYSDKYRSPEVAALLR